jgi:tetratricopeptide (TPR) repeat protein
LPLAINHAPRWGLNTKKHSMHALDINGEAEWHRLKTHLEWSEGFLLGFIFSAHPQVVEEFRARLASIYRARVTGLQEWHSDDPAKIEEFIPRLLHPTMREEALNAPVWLNLSRLDKQGESDWRKARVAFLSRLNEQREPLRQRRNRPLILILPAIERAETKVLTPDLWAIRTFCLDTQNWLQALPTSPPIQNTTPSDLFPLSAYEQQMVDEWERVNAPKTAESGDKKSPALLHAGWAAFNALYRKRHLTRAEQIAHACLELARQTPEALRDLSISLNNVGKTAQALGRWEDARAAFDESLKIRRQILARVGETPEALRDLSISLNNIANVERALGDIAQALAALQEGLAIGERLAAALPEHEDYKNLARYFHARLHEVKTGALTGT